MALLLRYAADLVTAAVVGPNAAVLFDQQPMLFGKESVAHVICEPLEDAWPKSSGHHFSIEGMGFIGSMGFMGFIGSILCPFGKRPQVACHSFIRAEAPCQVVKATLELPPATIT
ncbi:hypothetical protein [Caballeronia arationis]|uniref:hypothetical protein n=1 Tax=Caballeronia arationis TaxID=1777142 RepID=UPI0013568181|nr:hypothetical protein [Caballeronia arationis]